MQVRKIDSKQRQLGKPLPTKVNLPSSPKKPLIIQKAKQQIKHHRFMVGVNVPRSNLDVVTMNTDSQHSD